MFATLMLAALAAFSPIPEPTKFVTHVEALDSTTVMVVYADLSVVISPLDGFSLSERGEARFTSWFTTIEQPGDRTRDNVTKWTDVNGLSHEVRTGCSTLNAVDCALQHQKDVNAMLAIFPAPKPAPITQ